MHLFRVVIFLGLGLSLSGVILPDHKPKRVVLQFFGDVFIPKTYALQTHESVALDNVFSQTKSLLDEANINIVNLEGVVDRFENLRSHHDKTYHLAMPGGVPKVLADAGIHVATLANNHSMDFGVPGIFDSVVALEQAGIQTVGAGSNQTRAFAARTLHTALGDVALLSFNRTYPETIWATDTRAGTASGDYASMVTAVKHAKEQAGLVAVTFHWGEELSHTPKEYQQQLAHLMIDAGADAVIGHHPHVLQPVEFYKGKLIAYSLGNFAFGSRPSTTHHEGMAVQLIANEKGIAAVAFTELDVNNHRTVFIPSEQRNADDMQLPKMLSEFSFCKQQRRPSRWMCRPAKN